MESKDFLDQQIEQERKTIFTDKVDVSWGQLANMYRDQELIIQPEYQRLYRWTIGQKTRFIESILLGLPVPALFVAENEDGIWELVDGLQRVSTVLEFMGFLKDPNDPHGKPLPKFRASFDNTDPRLPALEGRTFDDLSHPTQLWLKRASCRVEVIKVGSSPDMKYEVFERLNTGGSWLTEQEVRNCIFRAMNPSFAEWVDRLAEYPAFKDHLNLSEHQSNTLFDRGLVLRFFALKNWRTEFKHDVEPFITKCFKDVLTNKRPFNMVKEEELFRRTFDLIANVLDGDAWRHIRQGRPRGGFSVYVFEALSIGVAENIDLLESLPSSVVAERLNRIKTSEAFRENTGSGANSRTRLMARIQAAIDILRGGQ